MKRESSKTGGGDNDPRRANQTSIGSPSGQNLVRKQHRITKREVEEWNALCKRKAPTHEPDGREAAYDDRCEEEECRELIRKFTRESAKRTSDDIGEILDRYQTIVLELLAARNAGPNGTRYSLGSVLLKECTNDKALKDFLVSLRKWTKAFVLRYYIYRQPHNTWVMHGSDVRAIKTLRGHAVSEVLVTALGVEYVRDPEGLMRFLKAVFEHWRKIFEPHSLWRQRLLVQQHGGRKRRRILKHLQRAGAIPTDLTPLNTRSCLKRIGQYLSRDQRSALKKKR